MKNPEIQDYANILEEDDRIAVSPVKFSNYDFHFGFVTYIDDEVTLIPPEYGRIAMVIDTGKGEFANVETLDLIPC